MGKSLDFRRIVSKIREGCEDGGECGECVASVGRTSRVLGRLGRFLILACVPSLFSPEGVDFMREEEMAIAIIAMVFGFPLMGVLGSVLLRSLTRVACHWRDVQLKIRLAEQGMSASEIQQVVQAGRANPASLPNVEPHESKPRKPPKTDYALKY
jgi:hypothetical protein